jgi:uncharacterized protein YjcR
VARARSPNRDKAFKLWKDSGGKMLLKDIADVVATSATQIRKWKNLDDWEAKLKGNVTIGKRNVTNETNSNVTIKKVGAPKGNQNAKGSGAPIGNKNALGNSGGAPLKNKNAVFTGEYQTIWLDMMDETEQALIGAINTDPIAQLDEDIRLLTLRERRMLKHLNDLKEQKALVETKDVYGMQSVPVVTEIYDEKSGTVRTAKIKETKKVLVEQTETTKLLIDKILRVEEALTRVQMAKTRAIESKHRILLTIQSDSKDEGVTIVDDLEVNTNENTAE